MVGETGTILAYRSAAGKIATKTAPSAPASAKVKEALTLTATVSPAAATGSVTIVRTHTVGKKWRAAGSAKVAHVGGQFACTFTPTIKGSWRFVASFSGGVAGGTTKGLSL